MTPAGHPPPPLPLWGQRSSPQIQTPWHQLQHCPWQLPLSSATTPGGTGSSVAPPALLLLAGALWAMQLPGDRADRQTDSCQHSSPAFIRTPTRSINCAEPFLCKKGFWYNSLLGARRAELPALQPLNPVGRAQRAELVLLPGQGQRPQQGEGAPGAGEGPIRAAPGGKRTATALLPQPEARTMGKSQLSRGIALKHNLNVKSSSFNTSNKKAL